MRSATFGYRRLHGLWLAMAIAIVAGCSSVQSRFEPFGERFPAQPDNHEIAVFRFAPPDRAFARVARLDVHLEKTHFIGSSFDDALPELFRQARLAGADAIIEIEERSSRHLETRIYHVSATAIRYRQP